MKTNDIKKGMRIRLANDWEGTMMDNKRGNIRFAEVEGYYTEMGSVYAHDIVAVLVEGKWVSVEHTEVQLECKRINEFLF